MPLPFELLLRECSFPHRLNTCNNDDSKSDNRKQLLVHVDCKIFPQNCSPGLEALAFGAGSHIRTREKENGEERKVEKRLG